MFKNRLDNYETYSKSNEGYDVEYSFSCYEVYIELSRDKEGNVLKNRDGSDRYHAIGDENISVLENDIRVKKIRDNFYKDVYEVNGDIVEKIEREGKQRAYYIVDEERLVTLTAGTKVVYKNGTYRIPSEIGYALVDERDIENPKIVAVRKFKTDDHAKEAMEIVRGRNRRNQEE